MDTSAASRELIESCFLSIGGVKSFISFTRIRPDQQHCIDHLREKAAEVYSVRGRDLHLSDLITSITGDDGEETDEPIGEGAFSQYRFYRTYVHDLRFYPEKFDFLLKCIENAVCVVQRPVQFEKIIDRLTSRGMTRRVPDAVVNYDLLLQKDEEERVESFTLRKDWVCRVPHYLAGLPALPASDVDCRTHQPANGGSFTVPELMKDLHDRAVLDQLVAFLKAHSPTKANPHQCRVLLSRLVSIHNILQRMQTVVVSPRLLSVFRSAAYLVQRMHSPLEWRAQVVQRLAAAEFFRGLRERIKMVWSLQSTVNWEKEDNNAAAQDEAHGIALLRSWGLGPAEGGDEAIDIVARYRRRRLNGWKVDPAQLLPANGSAAGGASDLLSAAPAARGDSSPFGGLFGHPSVPPAAGGSTVDFLPDINNNNSSLVGSLLSCGRPCSFSAASSQQLTGVVDAGGSVATLPYPSSFTDSNAGGDAPPAAAGRRTPTADNRAAALEAADAGGSNATQTHARCKHFSLTTGLSLHGTPVAVLTLHPAVSISPSTLEAFVVDCAARVEWCHPGLTGFFGGYADRLDPIGVPYLALGLVSEHLLPGGPTEPAPFVTLHDFIFRRPVPLSLPDAVDIALQVADALQYVLFSAGDVPAEVVDAWLTLSPRLIYVRHPRPPPPLGDDDDSGGDTAAGLTTAELALAPSLSSAPSFCTASSSTIDPSAVAEKFLWEVKLLPGLYVENGPCSRWQPHPDAADAGCYALSQLLVAMLSRRFPFEGLHFQSQLRAVRGADVAAAMGAARLPDGFPLAAPPVAALPFSVQQLLRAGLAHRGDSQALGSLQRWRQEWGAFSRALPAEVPADVSAASMAATSHGTGELEDFGFDDVAVCI